MYTEKHLPRKQMIAYLSNAFLQQQSVSITSNCNFIIYVEVAQDIKTNPCTLQGLFSWRKSTPDTFSFSQMEAQFCIIQAAISRARPNYPSTGLYYRSIGTEHTEQIGAQTLFLFLLLSLLLRERKKEMLELLWKTRMNHTDSI